MKIRDAKGRTDGNSGYTRALGNDELGRLVSRVQSTVISNGTELERIIVSLTNPIHDLDLFINNVTDGEQENGVYLCQKKVLKKSSYAIRDIEPDLLIFIVDRHRICKVILIPKNQNPRKNILSNLQDYSAQEYLLLQNTIFVLSIKRIKR